MCDEGKQSAQALDTNLFKTRETVINCIITKKKANDFYNTKMELLIKKILKVLGEKRDVQQM